LRTMPEPTARTWHCKIMIQTNENLLNLDDPSKNGYS